MTGKQISVAEERLDETFNSNRVIEGNTSTIYRVVKRTIDIVGSIVGLLLLSPIFLLLFILMQIEEFKAPFIFFQDRVGKNKSAF